MRNKIFGGIGVLWGGGILAQWLFSGAPLFGDSAYLAGRLMGLLFGAAMFGLGLHYIFKKPDNKVKHTNTDNRPVA